MLMERIGEDGGRREVTPAEMAQVDQIMARHDEISHRLVHLFGRIGQAARDDDTDTVAVLTAQLRQLIYTYFPMDYDTQGAKDVVDFVLYLIGLLESAREMQSQSYDTADAILHALVTLLPENHPITQSPYFGQDQILKRIKANVTEKMLSRLSQSETYTCGDGTKLHNVHTDEQCVGTFCVIHNPAPGPWGTWPTTWMEELRLMGRVCPHDIVHVAVEDLLTMPTGLTEVHNHGDSGCDCPCDLSRVEMIINDDGQLTGFRPITQ